MERDATHRPARLEGDAVSLDASALCTLGALARRGFGLRSRSFEGSRPCPLLTFGEAGLHGAGSGRGPALDL